MPTAITPWTARSATVSVGMLTEGWTLDQPVADHLAGDRSFSTNVVFDEPFKDVPLVQVAVQGFDIDQRMSGRLRLSVSGITAEGFILTITSWRDSRVFSVDVAWLALGA